MNNRTIVLFSLTVLGTVFLLSILWEFVFEFPVLSAVGGSGEPETFAEHVKYILTVNTFVVIALIAPTLILVYLNTRRIQAEEAYRQTDARFRHVLAASPAGIFLKDLRGRFLFSNPAHRELHGNLHEIEGKTVRDLYDAEQAEMFERQDKEVASSGQAQEYEYKYVSDAGKHLFFSMVKFPIFDADGNITGVGGINTDISERKRAEQALLQTMEETAQASQLKSTYLAHMSHELRTPLNAIMGFSKMMVECTFGPLGSPRYAEYATIIHDSGEHLLSLISDVLDLSRIEAGRIEPKPEPIDLKNLISGSIDVVRGQAMAKDKNIYSEISENFPLLLADRRMVKQMLLNLLSNAVKFSTPPGNIKIAAAVASDGGITISVADSGEGIARKYIPVVLAPYGRIPSPDRIVRQGTGLGLPLVVELLKLHRGKLEIESEPDMGTTMSMSFPPDATLGAVRA